MLLESRGNVVELLALSNDRFAGVLHTASVACGAVYSRKARLMVQRKIADFTPDLVHVHNFFPQLSPSVYYACRAAGVPVVQTLHNFRLICPNALLFKGGRPCERCIGTSFAWPGVVNACYRNSFAGTAVIATMLAAHRSSNTWTTQVNAYICLSAFAQQKFIAGGLPADRLFVKPNCVMPDPGPGSRSGEFAVFVGRLSDEKGLKTLLSAWAYVPSRKLKVVGDGPLASFAKKVASPNVEFLGRQPATRVLELLGAAKFLIFPSECYENFPRVIVEAFAKGLPVLGSDLGSMREIIEDGRTGMLFTPGDNHDLGKKAEWLFSHPHESRAMSAAARQAFEANYATNCNYQQLMRIYDCAIVAARQSALNTTS